MEKTSPACIVAHKCSLNFDLVICFGLDNLLLGVVNLLCILGSLSRLIILHACINKELISLIITALSLVLAWIIFIVDLMSVVCAPQTCHDIVVFFSALRSCEHTLWVFKVKQIISCLDGLQSMGDHDDCQVPTLLLLYIQDGFLHLSLTDGIQGTSCFIENQNLWTLDQCTSNGNALLLAARQISHSARANVRIELLLKSVDKLSVGKIDCPLDILLGGIFVSIQKIVANRTNNQNRFLSYPSNHFSKTCEIDVLKRCVSISYGTLIWVIESIK